MPNNNYQRRRTARRIDVIKVTIEDVNLTATPSPVAQGRDRKDWGLFDIDLSHGVGGAFPTPAVGEVWWIKRGGRAWVLDHKVDLSRTPSEGSGGGGGGTGNRTGTPANVVGGFNVREQKTALEYEAFVTFDAVTVDENGDPQDTASYVIDWVPTTKDGNIVAGEKVRQHLWDPNDAEIDDPLDPAADYYASLPGNVPRPKVWYWKFRVRGVSDLGRKGPWSAWTDPVLPFRVGLPQPPAPSNVAVEFRWKDSAHHPIFSAVVQFNDVNYWDIPGYDFEDDVSSYQVQLEPLQRNDASGTIVVGGHSYDRADPNGDGKPWPVRRQEVKDKDDDDNYVALGTLAQNITGIDTIFQVDETGVVGVPATPFIVLVSPGSIDDGSKEKWLVTSRSFVAANTYQYEVYRQFGNTPFLPHSTGASLKWLKDPFVYHVDFDHIERPRTVYWRSRARSKDRFNRLGPWSPWTDPGTPWRSIDWQVPRPKNLKADIQIREYKTHPEYKLVAKFEDAAPNGWNLPGGDLQDDLARYHVVAEALLPDPDGYIDGGDGLLYKIPDRVVGSLAALSNPADTTATITLNADLPDSIVKVIDRTEEFFLRIETVDPDNTSIKGNEIVAVTAVDEPSPPYPSDLSRVITITRAQKGSGDHGHNAGDKVYLLTEHLRRQTVHDRDEDDPGHFNHHYSVDLGHIPHATRLWWHVRALSVDTFGHRSEWTAWTLPINPAFDPDLIIDPPNYVRLSFDRVHRDRWTRWRPVVEFAEVHYTAPDGDREVDTTRYGVQLATTDGDELDVDVTNSQASITVVEKRRAPNEVPFSILLDDEIMEVTARTQVADILWSYTVSRGQKGTIAAAHIGGSRVYGYPFLQQTVSAKQDDDKNDFNRVAFPKAQKFRHYKARVIAFDRFNRRSLWTPWTPDGTPSDTAPPPPPTGLFIDIDNHKIVAEWDFPTEPDDTDPDLRIPSDDVAYFQTQLSTNNFATILKFDRYEANTRKVWRVKKPGNGTFYVRVRSVDGSGNKSAWVKVSGAQNGVPTPDPPTITYDVNEVTNKIRANVLLAVGVTHLDDDINGYEFELQPADFKRTTEPVGVAEVLIDVNGTANLPATNFTAYMQAEEVLVTNVSGSTFTMTRAQNSTTAVIHRNGVRVQYFRAATHARRRRTGEETSVDDPILCIFSNIERGLWYRARVRAKNTKGLWGNWSNWS